MLWKIWIASPEDFRDSGNIGMGTYFFKETADIDNEPRNGVWGIFFSRRDTYERK